MQPLDEAAQQGFEEALRLHQAEELVDRAPCGYLSTSPDGLILAVNQTFLTWTGYRREQLMGRKRLAELLSPGGRIYFDTHLGPMLVMQGRLREIALEVVRADNSRMPVLVNAVLEQNDDGRPAVVRAAVFDATERRAYERELLRAKETAEAAEHRAMVLARTLQDTLIPPAPPAVPGLDIGAAYRPSGRGDEVGGDFYDVFQVADDDWVVVIGDVAGKGVEAAVVTALARYTLRGAAVRSRSPSEALEILNSVLLSEEIDRFCTVSMVRLHRLADGWTAVLASGGHLPPLLKRPGHLPEPIGKPGTLLGVFANPFISDTVVHMGPGDGLLLYTDGVTEARRGREFFGEERLVATLDRLSDLGPSDLASGLVTEVLAFQEQLPRDDIAAVAIKVPRRDS